MIGEPQGLVAFPQQLILPVDQIAVAHGLIFPEIQMKIFTHVGARPVGGQKSPFAEHEKGFAIESAHVAGVARAVVQPGRRDHDAVVAPIHITAPNV